MLDGSEIQNDFNPLDAADAHTDPDADGYTNLQEHQFRTKPNAFYSQPAYLPRGLVAWWKT